MEILNYSPNTANAEAKAAIRAFFEAKTNDELFDRWQDAVTAIDSVDNSTMKAWFYFWCYQNIKVVDARNGETYRLAPFGFELCSTGQRSVVVYLTDARYPLDKIPLDVATIRMGDPSWLCRKLGM